MSVPFDVQDALAWTGGRLVAGSESARFTGARIDTRAIEKGDLFVAIRGERHDAHGFLAQAQENGAAGVVVDERFASEGELPRDGVVIAVPDTTAALGALAAGHRAGFAGPIVAVTGSNGKTTTKEIAHAILSVVGPCLKNRGNLNNEFGLPLTLLAREPEHWAAMVELGMNHRGEIARLAAIATPDVGIVTNVGTAHIEFLGTQDNIALEKGDLIAALDAAGTAVLNADDPRVDAMHARAAGRVVRYGRSAAADVRAEDMRFLAEDGAFAFALRTPAGDAAVRIAGLAETTVINALAATAGALAAGATLEQVVEGLGRFEEVAGRMVGRRLPGGAFVVDDTYNANPQSVRSALESLARLKGEGRGIAVLGDMGELGDEADAAHEACGRLAAELGTDWLFAVGEQSERVVAGARAAGLATERAVASREHAPVSEALRALLRAGDWVLVKGSRAMRMERIVEALLGEETA